MTAVLPPRREAHMQSFGAHERLRILGRGQYSAGMQKEAGSCHRSALV